MGDIERLKGGIIEYMHGMEIADTEQLINRFHHECDEQKADVTNALKYLVSVGDLLLTKGIYSLSDSAIKRINK